MILNLRKLLQENIGEIYGNYAQPSSMENIFKEQETVV
jgi:hypothetical protein